MKPLLKPLQVTERRFCASKPKQRSVLPRARSRRVVRVGKLFVQKGATASAVNASCQNMPMIVVALRLCQREGTVCAST